jgi:Uma2 family endonuclease
MSQIIETSASPWTAVDLIMRFGAIPLNRVLHDPPPGTAVEQDAIDLCERENRLCELVDNTLVEKTNGSYESYLAVCLSELLSAFVRKHRLGIVLGADALMRLAPGLVRIPDVSYVSWDRLPDRKPPRVAIADLAPDLAVEIISRGNTRQEMDRKLHDYFAAGVRLVWYVYHEPRREVHVYTGPEQCRILGENESLDGGAVLPGFQLPLADLFAEPTP